MVQTQIIHDTIRDTSGHMTHRHDSTFIRDSIVTIIRGDTVMIDRWHTRDRIQLRVDTVERIRTVTKLRTETQTVTVTEYRLGWWHKLWLWTATILALVAAAYIVIKKIFIS